MFEFISLLFNTVWELYKLPFPGLDIPIGSVVLGALAVVFSLNILGNMTGMSFSVKSLSQVRGGNNSNIKVSEKRKGDTH